MDATQLNNKISGLMRYEDELERHKREEMSDLNQLRSDLDRIIRQRDAEIKASQQQGNNGGESIISIDMKYQRDIERIEGLIAQKEQELDKNNKMKEKLKSVMQRLISEEAHLRNYGNKVKFWVDEAEKLLREYNPSGVRI